MLAPGFPELVYRVNTTKGRTEGFARPPHRRTDLEGVRRSIATCFAVRCSKQFLNRDNRLEAAWVLETKVFTLKKLKIRKLV